MCFDTDYSIIFRWYSTQKHVLIEPSAYVLLILFIQSYLDVANVARCLLISKMETYNMLKYANKYGMKWNSKVICLLMYT
jgi:hypothetical protein